jgi:hypothetical protein
MIAFRARAIYNRWTELKPRRRRENVERRQTYFASVTKLRMRNARQVLDFSRRGSTRSDREIACHTTAENSPVLTENLETSYVCMNFVLFRRVPCIWFSNL